MLSISGSIGGMKLDAGMYDYYKIVLEANGNARLESKGAGDSAVTAEATFDYDKESGVLNLYSKANGMTVTETMSLVDGVITYNTTISDPTYGQIIMNIVLNKTAE